MISIEEALGLIQQHAHCLPSITVPLAEAAGLVLAEDVASDFDSPPHDKAMVDGYALISSDLAGGGATLRVLEEVTAGDVPTQTVYSGTASRVMTGAPIPAGADAMVMIEQTERVGENQAKTDARPAPGDHIMPRGTSMQRGERVMARGTPLRPIEIGVLCEVGRHQVAAVRRPRVAVLSTGNELVDASQKPGPGQIRNSNGPLLAALTEARGAVPVPLGIARDDEQELTSKIEAGLQADILLLSGGVSAGVLDLVPAVLQQQGVEQVFHKVRLKPGKPVWFGARRQRDRTTLVFGLPGNPVSSFACFHLFVRPALARLAGEVDRCEQKKARLTVESKHHGDRLTYHPAVVRDTEQGPTVETIPWHGSADLRSLTAANALVALGPGECVHKVGELRPVVLI